MFCHVDPLIAKLHTLFFEQFTKRFVSTEHVRCRKGTTLIYNPMRRNAKVCVDCLHCTTYEPC